MSPDALLVVEGWSGGFQGRNGFVSVLEDVSFSVPRGEMSAIVGESGSGKSMTALSVLGLAPEGFVRTAGSAFFEGTDLAQRSERKLTTIRGSGIAIVFQDARSALNPVFTVGHQLVTTVRAHRKVSRREAIDLAAEALHTVRIPDVRRRLRQYPHEFSGGMAQRVALAQALLCEPDLLFLDEPTTGLDVTIQADVMDLVADIARERHMTSCLITHDLGLVGQYCDDVVVMQHGTVRERIHTRDLFDNAKDEYTRALIASSDLSGLAETRRVGGGL